MNATNGLISLYSVAPDAAVRDSSGACSQRVSNFGVEALADPRLYAAAVRAQHERLPAPADRQLATLYVEQARHAGGALDSATRTRTTALFQRLSDLERDYGLALAHDTTRIAIDSAAAAALPSSFRAAPRPAGAGFTIRVDESTLGTFGRNVPSPDARHRFRVAYLHRGGTANVERLQTAIAVRDTLAHLLGFPNWAAYQFDVKMAKTPERVVTFLRRIDDGLLPKARAEVDTIAALAARDGVAPIRVSDLGYYGERVRRARYALDAEVVRQYFPVEHVVPAVLAVYQELLGLRFTEVTPADAWAPGVRKFAVADAATGRPMGTVYLDLFPRPNKYGHFADFGLRYARRRADGSREAPVTAIVGNWPEPAGGRPALLTHANVVLFFHEFGHATAAVCDESPYVTTGTSGLRQDFVEALSQMLENWMWQPAVLRRVSRHVATGVPLPDSLVARMLALKHFDDGRNGTQQAFFGLYDMALHAGGPAADPNALWERMEGELTAFPPTPGTLPTASFGHLMGFYSAGYYAYLWSKVYAQDLFTRFEREGVLNAATGRAYRAQALAPGATVEPDVLLQRFLGRPLRYDAFFCEMGVAR